MDWQSFIDEPIDRGYNLCDNVPISWKVMSAGRKKNETSTRNDRSEEASLVGTHGHVVLAMDDECWKIQPPEHLLSVTSIVY